MKAVLTRLVYAAILSVSLLLGTHDAWAATVNLNTATAAELETLPGIGPSKSAAILAYRQANGSFKSVEELDAVDGIGPATMANLRALVTVGDGKATTGAAKSDTPPAGPAVTTSPSPAPAACAVNINSADAAGLKSLPGIGDTKADAIVQYRTDHGAFKSCQELDAVTGIGPATLAGLLDCCAVK